MSYSIYMTHFLVVTSALWALKRWDAETFDLRVRVLVIGLSAALVAVIAIVTYYVVEEPARHVIRRRAHRRVTDLRQEGSVRGTARIGPRAAVTSCRSPSLDGLRCSKVWRAAEEADP